MLQKIHIGLTAIAIGSCIVLAVLLSKSCNNIADLNNFKDMYNASNDTLHKTRNELGQEKTTTSLLLGTVSNLKDINSSKDASLARLQKLVDKKTISATVFSTTTSGTSTSATTVIPHDTIRSKKDSLVYVYPEYVMKRDSGRWRDISGKATKDSFSLHYKIFNDYDIKQDWEKKKGFINIFSPKVPIVSVVDLNPYTETRELKSFSVKPQKYYWIKTFLKGVATAEIARIIYNSTNKK